MEHASTASILYRGRMATDYSFGYNGTYYWENPRFEPGSVRYNGKDYDEVKLNIDAMAQDLLVAFPGTPYALVAVSDCVDSFVMGGRPFIHARRRYGESAPEGYMEVLHDGKAKLYRQVRKKLETDTEGRKASYTGYDGPYNPQISSVFVRYSQLYLDDGSGRLVPVRSRRSLLSRFPEWKRQMKRSVAQERKGESLSLDEYCRAALQALEELSGRTMP